MEEVSSAAFDGIAPPAKRGFEGGSRPIMRLVTLLAVADIGCACGKSMEAGGDASSTGETPAEAALFLPKVSFHFDGFLVTGAGGGGTEGGGGAGGRELLRSSKDFLWRLLVEDEALVEADLRDEDLEALLISLARD